MPATLTRIETSPDDVEQVCAALVDAISAGHFAPGEWLTQEDIARRLPVSRQPVRRQRPPGAGHDRRRSGLSPGHLRGLGQPALGQQLGGALASRAPRDGAVLQRSNLRQAVWDEHEAIAPAIAAGRGAEAERLMAAHTRQAAAHMVEHFTMNTSHARTAKETPHASHA